MRAWRLLAAPSARPTSTPATKRRATASHSWDASSCFLRSVGTTVTSAPANASGVAAATAATCAVRWGCMPSSTKALQRADLAAISTAASSRTGSRAWRTQCMAGGGSVSSSPVRVEMTSGSDPELAAGAGRAMTSVAARSSSGRAGSISAEWNPWAVGSIVALAPSTLSSSAICLMASASPLSTQLAAELNAAKLTFPPSASTRGSSASGVSRTASIAPEPVVNVSIALPLSRASSSACSRERKPPTQHAAISPSECPKTAAGATAYSVVSVW